MQQLQHFNFISRYITTTNSTNSFAFNQISNTNYLTLYTKVYSKRFIHMTTSIYNQYMKLDLNHIIGEYFLLEDIYALLYVKQTPHMH
jgi:hypothetical protein